jgi:hypothetical protein
MAVIRINVLEDAGCDRKAEPLTLGVPFPEGALEDTYRVRLTRNGNMIPCQREVTSRWPDGSVRWLLLDFLADVNADETAIYHLEYGNGVADEGFESHIEVKSDDDKITLLNGAMELTLSKDRFAVPDSVRLISDSEPVPVISRSDSSGFTVTVGDDTLSPVDFSVDSIEVERSGPIHAVVKVEASASVGGKSIRHIVRLHVYLNQSFVRMEHVFMNATPRGARYSEEPSILLKTLSCSLSTSFRGSEYEIGRGWGELAGPLETSIELTQKSASEYLLVRRGSDVETGDQSPGWIHVTGDESGVTALVKDFWQKFPKTLRLTSSGLIIGLYESQQGQLMDGGEANCHEMILDFCAGDGWAEDIASNIARFQRPLLAFGDPEWYSESGAFGDIGGPHEKYDKIVDRMIDAVIAAREDKNEYGFKHYGDWDYSNRYERGWGNLEYDTAHGYLMHFARTGMVESKRKCLDYARSALLHYREVDIIHAATDEMVLGGPVVHTTDHRCNSPTPSHTWLEGLLEHYYMTGDVRSYEKAVGVGEYLLRSSSRYEGGNVAPRVPGWLLIGLTAIYEATLDRKYMDAAESIVGEALKSQRDNGAWVYPHSESPYQPYYIGGKAFMVGILLTGLCMYHKLTGDEDAAAGIIRGARWLIHESWCVEKRAFKYIQCAFSKSYSSGVRMIRGIDYAYRLSGYEELKIMSEEVCDAWFSGFASTSGFSGRRMAEPLREVPYFLHLIK